MRPERTLIRLSCMLSIQLFAVSALSAPPASDPEAEACAALENFLIAFNSGDKELVRQQLHFPHVTHRANSIFVADQPADFAIPYESNWGSGWARSRWDNVETYLVSDEKVNLGVDFSRLNAAAPFGNQEDLPPPKQFPEVGERRLASELGEPGHVIRSSPWGVPANGQDLWWEP